MTTKTKRGLLLSLASLVVTLIGFEVLLRYRDHQETRRKIAARNEPGVNVSLGTIKQYSANDRIVFELKPDLDRVMFMGVPVSTSAQGFRSPLVAETKPADVIRVIGLGDSVMFGWGVAREESFPAQLQDLLNEAYPTRTWEVVNTAVPGYNTRMEVATLREKGLPLDPDIVVLNLVSNDLNLPTNLLLKRDPLGFGESFLLTHLRERMGLVAPAGDLFLPLEGSTLKFELYEQDPTRVRPEHRGLVGWDSFEEALTDLVAMSEEYDFEVVTVRQWKYQPVAHEMNQRAEARGISGCVAIKTPDQTRPGWPLEHGLVLGAEDPHPTPRVHRVMAEVLFDHLVATGAVARAME